MIIEDKYFDLVNILVYDKRIKQCGILSGIVILPLINACVLCYEAYIDRFNSSTHIFVEDIEEGNVVFLIPFGTDYMVEELEKLGKIYTERIKSFFGDKFREDMIMRMSEEERQKEIRKKEELSIATENWYKHFWNEQNEKANTD